MTEIGKIAVSGGRIGHQCLGTGVLINTSHSRSGIIAANLGTVYIGIVHRHTLHTVTAVLVIDQRQFPIAAVMLLGYRVGNIHRIRNRQQRHRQSNQQNQTQRDCGKSLHLIFHHYSPLIKIHRSGFGPSQNSL